MTFAAEVLADAPLGYWKLDDAGSATTYVDSSGGGHNLAVTGTDGAVVAGAVDGGSARNFTAACKARNADAAIAQPSGDSITMVALVQISSLTPSNHGHLCGWRSGVSGSLVFYMLQLINSNSFEIRIGKAGGGFTDVTCKLVTGLYYMLHAVYNGPAGTFQLYVNGNLVQTVTGVATNYVNSATAGAFTIGTPDDASSVFPYIGRLDDVAVFPQALSPARIAAQFKAFSAGASITQTAQVTGSSSSAAFTVTAPKAGSVLYALISTETTTTWSATGWTQLAQVDQVGSNDRIVLLYKVAAGTEGTTITFTGTQTHNRSAVFMEVFGVRPPIADDFMSSLNAGSVAGGTIAGPSRNAPVAGTIPIAMWGANTGASGTDTVSGWTVDQIANSSFHDLVVAHSASPSAGASIAPVLTTVASYSPGIAALLIAVPHATGVATSITTSRTRSQQADASAQTLMITTASLVRARSQLAGAVLITKFAASASLLRQRIVDLANTVETSPLNNWFSSPEELVGNSGTLDFTTNFANTEDTEPDAVDGTVWFYWAPGDILDATFEVDSGIHLDLYSHEIALGTPDFASLVPVGQVGVDEASGAFVTTRPTEEYYLRAYPLVANDFAVDHTLVWNAAIPDLHMRLIVNSLEGTPGVITAEVWDELPGSTISFYLDGALTPFDDITIDDTGDEPSFPIAIPDVLTVGTHTITATSDDGGKTIDLTFEVVAGVVDENDDVMTEDPQYPTFTPPPVDRWRLSDPTDGSHWDFPINPSTADSPLLPRALTPRETTSVLGQVIMFEGARRAKPWTLEGHLFSLDDLEDLTAWSEKPYRVYLTDDFGRTFLVMVEQVASIPVKDAERKEHFSYTAHLLLFGKVSTETYTKPPLSPATPANKSAITYPGGG